MARIERLSTDHVPAAQRFDFWRDVFASPDRTMSIEGEPEAFQGTFARLVAGEFEMTSVKSSPLVTRIAVTAEVEEANYSLHLVHSGRCLLRHAGVEIVAETGDMIVVDARKPYELAFNKPVQGLVLTLPWGRFGGHAKALEARTGRRVNLHGGPAHVLSGFIRSAWDQLVERDDEDWPKSASEVIWDLMLSVLQDESSEDFGGNRAHDLRRRAKALVSAQLFDPEFGSSAIAKALGVSTRYLQQAFAEVGTTPSRFLLAHRLDAAASRLRYPDGPCHITDVALECGFSDLSYFSRAFRRRFGVAAYRYRQSQGSPAEDSLY